LPVTGSVNTKGVTNFELKQLPAGIDHDKEVTKHNFTFGCQFFIVEVHGAKIFLHNCIAVNFKCF
jgi:hypothetical protein